MIINKSRNKNNNSVLNEVAFSEQRVCRKFRVRVVDKASGNNLFLSQFALLRV